MSGQFTASVYCKDERIAIQSGDDIDQLYAWMLIQVNGNYSDIHGEIVDNNTKKIIRAFRKAPIE